jgi:hypothetical protein
MRRALLVILAAGAAWSQSARPAPEDYYRQLMRDTGLSRNGYGEQFCWVAHYYQPTFLRAFQAWKDVAWLDWAVCYDDFLAAKMQTGPDGYRGWIGPYEYDGTVWCDVHVGDALLAGGMLELAEIVLKDDGLRRKYGDAARRYVELARKDVIEKWDRRGTWEEDGAVGAYRSWNHYGAPGELRDWRARDEVAGSSLALPFNKQNEMALVALRLYRITGEEQYRTRAEKIFAYAKSRFQYFDQHYVWNYWEPFGARDVDVAAHKTRHWVNVHPYRDYQQREVEQMVEAYRSGIVFTREDMERMVNTNLKVMWNGDLEAPKFRNSNATLPQAPSAAPRKDTAGALWGALAEFSPAVRELERRKLARGTGAMADVARAYFENVPPPPAPARVSPVDFPLHECAQVNLAAALPAVVRVGDESLLLANLLAPAEVEAALYSAGGVKEAVLFQGNRSGLVIVPWTPAAENRGAHRVRWTVDGAGCREVSVQVRQAAIIR